MKTWIWIWVGFSGGMVSSRAVLPFFSIFIAAMGSLGSRYVVREFPMNEGVHSTWNYSLLSSSFLVACNRLTSPGN